MKKISNRLAVLECSRYHRAARLCCSGAACWGVLLVVDIFQGTKKEDTTQQPVVTATPTTLLIEGMKPTSLKGSIFCLLTPSERTQKIMTASKCSWCLS